MSGGVLSPCPHAMQHRIPAQVIVMATFKMNLLSVNIIKIFPHRYVQRINNPSQIPVGFPPRELDSKCCQVEIEHC